VHIQSIDGLFLLVLLESFGNLLCPTEEESGMLMSLLSVSVHMCGGVGGKTGYLGPGTGLKNEQLIQSLAPVRTSQARRLLILSLIFATHALILLHVP
jgi:hypothetical protein